MITHYRGRPQWNMVQVGDKMVRREQTPVYATAAEARISGSGWLFWSEVRDGDRPQVTRLPPGPVPETPWCDEPRRRVSGCAVCGARPRGELGGSACACLSRGVAHYVTNIFTVTR